MRKLTKEMGYKLLFELWKRGLTNEMIEEALRDDKLLIDIVTLMEKDSFEPLINHERARQIMGKNFFGIEEAIKYFGIKPNNQQLADLEKIPFSKEIIRKSRENYILAAVFPISILTIQKKVDFRLSYNQSGDPWYKTELFITEPPELKWRLICKNPIPESTSKNWPQQLALLEKEDKVPFIQPLVYTIIGHYLATGERLFEDIFVRTSSKDSTGRHINVGFFTSNGLLFFSQWNKYQSPLLGLVTEKSESINK